MIDSLHPLVLTAMIAATSCVVFAILAFRASRRNSRITLAVLALVCAIPAAYIYVLLHPELTDARFRTYKAFYKDIQEGMPREQVFALLDHRYPPNGSRMRPKVMSDEPNSLGFFMNPETSSEPNCEGIFLTLHDGTISKKRYSVD